MARLTGFVHYQKMKGWGKIHPQITQIDFADGNQWNL